MLLERLNEEGFILRGHYVLPDGRHSDTYLDRIRLLENPSLLEPFIEVLANLVRPTGVTHVTGVSQGGMVMASQVGIMLNAKIHHLGFDSETIQIDPGARPAGARFALVNDFVVGSQDFDSVRRTLIAAGAEVAALGAAIALPVPLTEWPSQFYAAATLDARVFSAQNMPDWLRTMPVNSVDDWRSTSS